MLRDSGRVIDELQNLKDEIGLVAMAVVEVRASTARLKARGAEQSLVVAQVARKKARDSLAIERDATPKRARATIPQYKETLSLKFGLEKTDRMSYENGYIVTLACFRVKYPQMEIEEDTYTTLPKDDDVPMDVEVPFDDSDPLVT
ncbi:hypothetical protein B296_00000985 [Ensete ventricosum]|uniref:Uncharacterized protein n=1 Tax=Ensete ventricosum TaxID=4639 RepID=A0A427B218_ENSVE|nr:hypothetical protein B296_00000985 [Ensete ventricosum]